MPYKSKVLVMGHSWVQYIQEEHQRCPVEDFELSFVFEEGVRIDGLIEMIPEVVTPQHTHILLFSLLPDALYVQSINPEPERSPPCQVLVPNQDFNPEYFAQRMNIFTERCKMISPGIKVVLMIPPAIDLVRHNRIRVSSQPPNIKRSYMENLQFDDQLIYTGMMNVHSSMMLLKGKQFNWMDKRAYPLQYIAQLLNPSNTQMENFMNGKLFTLGKPSHLYDGFHPTTALIHKMWARIKSATFLGLNVKPSANGKQIAFPPPNGKQIAFPPPNLQMKRKLDGSVERKEFGQSKYLSAPKMLRKFESSLNVKVEDSQLKYNNLTFPPKNLSPPPLPPNFSTKLVKAESMQEYEDESYLLSGTPSQDRDLNAVGLSQARDSSVVYSENSQPAPAKSLQLVDTNYMRQEIDKFASFMAGHAHAVGQNLSIRDIKNMMITVLHE